MRFRSETRETLAEPGERRPDPWSRRAVRVAFPMVVVALTLLPPAALLHHLPEAGADLARGVPRFPPELEERIDADLASRVEPEPAAPVADAGRVGDAPPALCHGRRAAVPLADDPAHPLPLLEVDDVMDLLGAGAGAGRHSPGEGRCVRE